MGVACWRDGSQCSQGPRHSPRQRIGPPLEAHHLRPVLLTAFEMGHRSSGVGRP